VGRLQFLFLGALGAAIGLARVATELAWLAPLTIAAILVLRGGLRRFENFATPLVGAGGIAFYVAPRLRGSWHVRAYHELGQVIFFVVMGLLGLLVVRALPPRQTPTLRARRIERWLWAVAALTWALSLFGVYHYSLTRLAPPALLVTLAVAAWIRRGARAFGRGALPAIALLPLLFTSAESHNLDIALLDALDRVPALVVYLLAGSLTLCLLPLRKPPWRTMAEAAPLLALAAWAVLSIAVLEFRGSQVVAFSCCALGLRGLLTLVRRARLSPVWSALALAICLVLASNAAFEGFALSHVNFRFAAELVIPFRTELFRAAQLVVWACLKYAFAWLPIVWILKRDARAPGVVLKLLVQLGAWRLLFTAIATLGFRCFDKVAIHELCSEELYYWGWFSLFAWLAALTARGPSDAVAFRTTCGDFSHGASSF
jgi:hypothetical protein